MGTAAALLFSSELKQDNVARVAQPGDLKSVKKEHFLSSTLRVLGRQNDMLAISSTFKTEAKHDGKSRLSLEATYAVLVQWKEPLRGYQFSDEELADHAVRTAAWPQFRNLFSLVISQTGVDLPPLPVFPREIRIEKGQPALLGTKKQEESKAS